MKTIVMKFGGSSLADPEKIQIMAERAIHARAKGWSVAMVVSAPADTTDDLISLSKALTNKVHLREHDALISTGEQISAALVAMAIGAKGYRAISLSGAQAGIRTDARHADATILSISTARLKRELNSGKIVVVAGFQGAARNGDTTTLGRGGSDFTAVAMAKALNANICELYTDVKGIYTANPALVPQARMIRKISYATVMELARSGTEVRQLRAIAYAQKHKIPLHLRSSFETQEGTLVDDFHLPIKPEVICFSILKRDDMAEIHLLGAKLGMIESDICQAAKDSGCPILRVLYGREKTILTTTFQSGERLLKHLHRSFIH